MGAGWSARGRHDANKERRWVSSQFTDDHRGSSINVCCKESLNGQEVDTEPSRKARVGYCDGRQLRRLDKDDLDILVNMSDEKLWAHAQGCAQLIANADGEEIESTGDLPDSLEPESAESENSAAEGADDEQEVQGDEGEAGVTKTEPDEEKDQPKKCWTRRVTK